MGQGWRPPAPGPDPDPGPQLDLGAADQNQALPGRSDLGQTAAGGITKAIIPVYVGCLGSSTQGLHPGQKRRLPLEALLQGRFRFMAAFAATVIPPWVANPPQTILAWLHKSHNQRKTGFMHSG
ncbi:MAG: hypothetical protein RDU30_18000 [Desulfovibrionaceae bacterium]|nr:hypothetical protein [Desulfovibrionaceae bacterium]